MSDIKVNTGFIETNHGMHECYIFFIDESRAHGLLHATDELTLTYDRVEHLWTGDALGSDGWFDLDYQDVWEHVEKYGLNDVIEAANDTEDIDELENLVYDYCE